MSFKSVIKKSILNSFERSALTTQEIIVLLVLAAIIGIYIYFVYRFICKRKENQQHNSHYSRHYIGKYRQLRTYYDTAAQRPESKYQVDGLFDGRPESYDGEGTHHTEGYHDTALNRDNNRGGDYGHKNKGYVKGL